VQVEQSVHRRPQAPGQRECVGQPEADDGPRRRHQRSRRHRGRRDPRRHPEGDQPAERGERPQGRVEHAAARHLEDDVDRPAVVGLDHGVAQVGRVAGGGTGVERDVGAELAGQVTLLGGRGRGDDPAGAHLAGQLDGQASHAARGRVHDDGLAGRQMGTGAQQVPCGGALQDQGQSGGVVDRVGQRERRRRMGECLLGVPAGGDQRHDAATCGIAAHDFGARDERDLLRRQVVVGGLVRVRVVDPGRADVEQHQRTPWLGGGQVDDLEDLGTPEPAHLDGTHRGDSNAPFPADYCRTGRGDARLGYPAVDR
jgi:hypothetical protein